MWDFSIDEGPLSARANLNITCRHTEIEHRVLLHAKKDAGDAPRARGPRATKHVRRRATSVAEPSGGGGGADRGGGGQKDDQARSEEAVEAVWQALFAHETRRQRHVAHVGRTQGATQHCL